MKWLPWPFNPDGSKVMAVGHGGYVYVVGTWHGRDNWQGSVFKDHWLKDSKSFHGPTGQQEAMRWCEAQNKRHEPKRGSPRGEGAT